MCVYMCVYICARTCVYVCVCVCRLSVCDRIVAWILSQAHGIFSEPYVVTVDPITTVRPLPVSWLGPRSTYVQALQCFLQCTKNPLFIRKSGNAINYFTKSCSSNPCLMTSATGQLTWELKFLTNRISWGSELQCDANVSYFPHPLPLQWDLEQMFSLASSPWAHAPHPSFYE